MIEGLTKKRCARRVRIRKIAEILENLAHDMHIRCTYFWMQGILHNGSAAYLSTSLPTLNLKVLVYPL